MATSGTRNGRRVGVIGVGFGVAVHIPAYRAEGFEVTAICARTPETVNQAAKDLEIPNVFTDYRDLIASDQVDIVAVVTPPVSHAAPTLAAITAGKHVICEKPFAMNIAEARAMRDAAANAHVTTMVAHEFRYTPQRLQARALMEQGYVGEPRTVYGQANFALNRGGPSPMTWQVGLENGGGALGAIGSHFLDSIRWWVGDITEISASIATLKPERTDASGNVVLADGDDSFVINLKFANGAIGSFAYTAASPVMLGARTIIEGTEGVLVLPQAGVNPTSAEVVHGAKVGEEVAPLPRPAEFDPFPDDTDRRIPAFRRLVRDFDRGLKEGTSFTPNFADGFAVQAMLHAVRESSATGKAVQVATS
jgi:predicted dehydrogenase